MLNDELQLKYLSTSPPK